MSCQRVPRHPCRPLVVDIDWRITSEHRHPGTLIYADGYSETSWTSIPIDRGQFFQMMVDRASDTLVTTFSVSIGMGVQDSRPDMKGSCPDEVVSSFLTVGALKAGG